MTTERQQSQEGLLFKIRRTILGRPFDVQKALETSRVQIPDCIDPTATKNLIMELPDDQVRNIANSLGLKPPRRVVYLNTSLGYSVKAPRRLGGLFGLLPGEAHFNNAPDPVAALRETIADLHQRELGLQMPTEPNDLTEFIIPTPGGAFRAWAKDQERAQEIVAAIYPVWSVVYPNKPKLNPGQPVLDTLRVERAFRTRRSWLDKFLGRAPYEYGCGLASGKWVHGIVKASDLDNAARKAQVDLTKYLKTRH